MDISKTNQTTSDTSSLLPFVSDCEPLRRPSLPHSTLQSQFRQYFEILWADSPALRTEVYRIRYQVYCREVCLNGFSPASYPGGIEFDEFDEQAVHCILRHRPTGLLAGTMRVVLNDPAHTRQYFPIEKVARKFVSSHTLMERGIPRSAVGEISRFILASKFRSRRGESHWPDGMSLLPDTHYSDDRRSVLHPILGLMRAALEVSVNKGLRYWYAGMEPRFERRLRHMGVIFDPISPIIDYHGPCRAYLTHVPTLLARLRQLNFELWTLFTDAGRIRYHDDKDIYCKTIADAQA